MSSVLDKYKIAIETRRSKDIDSRLPAASQEKSFPFNATRRGSQRSSVAKRCSLDLITLGASPSTVSHQIVPIFSSLLYRYQHRIALFPPDFEGKGDA